MPVLRLVHLGGSGLGVEVGEARVAVDPPEATGRTTLVTWSEAERVRGAREERAATVVADARVLAALGRPGVAVPPGGEVELAGVHARWVPYAPIPWATPVEALRKVAAGLRAPRLAARRLRWTLRRPDDPPRALALRLGGARVALYGQSLHRFLDEATFARLVAGVGEADVAVAGTDYGDEAACARWLARVPARVRVVADLVGEVRRRLGLPTRPLAATVAAAPGLIGLPPGGAREVRVGEDAAPDSLPPLSSRRSR